MNPQVLTTGNDGLDNILCGGLPANRLYLVQGDPGVGKTTLAIQFLLEGAKAGEKVLYITLSETREELLAVGESHGWNLERLNLFELDAADHDLGLTEPNTLIHPAEVELREITTTLLEEVDRIQPSRVVFDSLSEIRLLAQDALRFRRQILSLKQYFAGKHCTVLMLDDLTSESGNSHLQSLAHGVIELQQMSPEFGAERRRIRIAKLRGVRFRGGYHDFTIARGGLSIFPRLIAAEHKSTYPDQALSSHVAGLDELLGGGLDRGTSTLLVGPAGTGKSSVAVHFSASAAKDGQRAALFLFDENTGTLMKRSQALGLDLPEMIRNKQIFIQQIDPAEMSPGEFAFTVRRMVEEQDVKVVIIDTLNGYMNAMPHEKYLAIQMHELLSYLNQKGVTSILVMAQHGFLGSLMTTPVDVSYLSDCVILLRYFEASGHVKKAISVVKKRSGNHESTIRQFEFNKEGLQVGDPLRDFQGVLTGVPSFLGKEDLLIQDSHHANP